VGEVSTIGLDLASQPRGLVAMEGCASAHYQAREIAAPSHETRLIANASRLRRGTKIKLSRSSRRGA